MDKKIQVTRSTMPSYQEYCEEIKDIWDNRWLTNAGPKHQRLQKELCEYLKVDNISLFANGHLALEAAIRALGIKGEVITTPFTFASTTHAIVRCNLTPVFCDVEPEYYTIDPAKIEALITENTSAIIPVHVYGNVCACEKIEKIAHEYGLKVIYDAAHAFGETINNQGVGSFGDISMFSFHATKVFHTIEGGALTFKNPDIASMAAAERQFGMLGKEDAETVGGNAKMTEFAAAMGICNLRHIEDEIVKRRLAAERYRLNLSGIKGLHLLPLQESVESNYAYFPVVFAERSFGKNRNDIAALLESKNIFARKYFYPLTSAFSAYTDRFNPGFTPIAAQVASEVLCLPMYSDLTEDEVDRICGVILEEDKL